MQAGARVLCTRREKARHGGDVFHQGRDVAESSLAELLQDVAALPVCLYQPRLIDMPGTV